MTPTEDIVTRLKTDAKLRKRGNNDEDFAVGQRFVQHWGRTVTEVDNTMFSTVFGLSVEDLSEIGGPFLGVEECVYARDVYPGDTLYATSKVIAARLASHRPGFGIVTWSTVGTAQNGAEVVSFKRSNLVKTRS